MIRASSGLKLHIQNLQTLSLNLGPITTTPLVSMGVSLNYGDFTTVNVSEGLNSIIKMPALLADKESVVRLNVEGWQDNRINLENILLNPVRSMIITLNLINDLGPNRKQSSCHTHRRILLFSS